MAKPVKKLSTTELMEKQKMYEAESESIEEVVEDEVMEEPKQPLKTVFYCQEYKDLSMDIKSPQMDVINGKRIYTQGKTIKFNEHQLETDDQEVIDHIRGHIWYGIKIIEQGA